MTCESCCIPVKLHFWALALLFKRHCPTSTFDQTWLQQLGNCLLMIFPLSIVQAYASLRGDMTLGVRKTSIWPNARTPLEPFLFCLFFVLIVVVLYILCHFFFIVSNWLQGKKPHLEYDACMCVCLGTTCHTTVNHTNLIPSLLMKLNDDKYTSSLNWEFYTTAPIYFC